MRTLVIKLPVGPSGPETSYEVGWVTTGASAATLQPSPVSPDHLPTAARGEEVVALLPAAGLSWHLVDLPTGLRKESARLQAVLESLLEDHLLDEPGAMCLFLQADWQKAGKPWVAACRREWLLGHLDALNTQGLPVSRIAPEFCPTSPPQAVVAGESTSGRLWLCDATQGVWSWPLVQLRAPEDLHRVLGGAFPDVKVDPAAPDVIELFHKRLECTALPVSAGRHWAQALQYGWSSAQLGLGQQARRKTVMRWQRNLEALIHEGNWRLFRRGGVALLLVLTLGLGTWTLATEYSWRQQRTRWADILRETFPDVQAVVDAPLQMEQEMARARQGGGRSSAKELQTMLSILGDSLHSVASSPSEFNFEDGVLHVRGLKLSDAEQPLLKQRMQSKGYTWERNGDTWQMRTGEEKR